jgi:predicted small lipoprotein YifL
MKQSAKIGGVLALALLAGCGKVGPLEPRAGQAAPAKAYGAEKVAGSEELMKPSEQARPGRSDELMRRSERRTNDPFDLPPGSEEDKAKEPAPADETTLEPK